MEITRHSPVDDNCLTSGLIKHRVCRSNHHVCRSRFVWSKTRHEISALLFVDVVFCIVSAAFFDCLPRTGVTAEPSLQLSADRGYGWRGHGNCNQQPGGNQLFQC